LRKNQAIADRAGSKETNPALPLKKQSVRHRFPMLHSGIAKPSVVAPALAQYL
jgi:hypothetical protein